MIPLLVLAAIVVIGGIIWWIGCHSDDPGSMLIPVGGLVTVASGVFLLIVGVSILSDRYTFRVKVAERDAFIATIATRKDTFTEMERAALLIRVAEWNQWLACTQYENKTWGDWSIPDEVDHMEPIK